VNVSLQVIVDDDTVNVNISTAGDDQHWSKVSKRFVCTHCNKSFTGKFVYDHL